MFITFEGLDCTGKTTQIEFLRRELKRLENNVVVTREPGGTPLAEDLRTFVKTHADELNPVSEALIFNAARVENFEKVVKPSMDKGFIVLGDRSFDSTFAYQGALGDKELDDKLLAIHEAVIGDFCPHLTVLFDIPVEEYMKRKIKRGDVDPTDGLEARTVQYFEKVRRNFKDIARRNRNRVLTIDGRMDVDQIHNEVILPLAKKINDLMILGDEFPRGMAFSGGIMELAKLKAN